MRGAGKAVRERERGRWYSRRLLGFIFISCLVRTGIWVFERVCFSSLLKIVVNIGLPVVRIFG
jgi:hypothetical protein